MVHAALLSVSGMVSFSCQPSALRNLTDDLGDVLGQKVIVGRELQNEVVVVEASDVSPEELKAKIASVVYGKWTTTEQGSLRLDLDPEAEDAQYALIEKKYVEAIKEWRKSHAGRYEAMKNRPVDIKELAISLQTKQTNSQSPVLPYSRLPFELIENIPDQELARNLLVGQAVYGANPTSLQKAIVNGDQIVKLRARQTSELSAELRRMGFADPTTEFDLATQFGAGYAPDIRPEGANVVLNFGGRRMRDLDYQLSTMFDAEGKMITSLNMIPSYRTLSATAGMNPGSPKDIKMEKPTEHVRGRITSYKNLIERSAKTEKLIIDMPFSDPIAWYFGDSLNAWAREGNIDFAAALPDSILEFAANDELFYDVLQWMGDQELGWKKEGSWRTAASWYPWEVRRDRMDRVAFANLANKIRRAEFPTAVQQVGNLDELRATESSLFRNLAASQPVLIPFYIGGMSRGSSRVSLVPSLSPGTVQSMLKGVRMSWRQLPAADREIITAAVCGRTGQAVYGSDEFSKSPIERDWRKVEPTIWMARPEMNNALVTLCAESAMKIALALAPGDMEGQTMINVYTDKLPKGGQPFAVIQASVLRIEIDLGGGVMIWSNKPVIEAEWLIERASN